MRAPAALTEARVPYPASVTNAFGPDRAQRRDDDGHDDDCELAAAEGPQPRPAANGGPINHDRARGLHVAQDVSE